MWKLLPFCTSWMGFSSEPKEEEDFFLEEEDVFDDDKVVGNVTDLLLLESCLGKMVLEES